jgi:tRNA nucleotidyltransferase/poly(A) polymerase
MPVKRLTLPESGPIKEALWVLRRLEDAGHEAHIVGGAVRDLVLGRAIGDVDIATSARPDEVTRLFERTIATGVKHGTVTVRRRGLSFEVTTYRRDGAYIDGRRPQTVEFSASLEQDLARRDFTMNAIAVDARGCWRDPYDGLADIGRQVIRAVGDAAARMAEDGLRVARGLRFAATLDFSIEPATRAALTAAADVLAGVAAERRQAEWNRFLPALRTARCAELTADIAQAWIGDTGTLATVCEPVTRLPQALWPRLALVAWAQSPHDAGATWLKSLRYSREDIDRDRALCHIAQRWLNEEPQWLDEQSAKARERFGDDILAQGIALADARCARLPAEPTDGSTALYDERAQLWLARSRLHHPRELALSGAQLAARHNLAGAQIGRLLSELYALCAAGELANTEAELDAYAQAFVARSQGQVTRTGHVDD